MIILNTVQSHLYQLQLTKIIKAINISFYKTSISQSKINQI